MRDEKNNGTIMAREGKKKKRKSKKERKRIKRGKYALCDNKTL